MSAVGEVLVAVEEGVGVITLAAPGRRNALTPDMARELVAACDTLDADTAVGAVVVRAEGGSFCAGGHRETLARAGEDPASDDNFDDLGLVYRAFARVGELAAPTVAAVRGAAVGAGVNLALATDLRVVAEDARLAPGFLRIGIHPGGGHFTLVGRLGARETAAALGLFGQELTGRRAVELGLAWMACPAGEVEERAMELARVAAADPVLARRAAALFRAELGPPPVSWPVALEAERATQMWSLRRRAMRADGGGAAR